MAKLSEAEGVGLRRRSRNVLVAIVAAPLLLITIIAAFYHWGVSAHTPQRSLESNWGLVVPNGLRLVEHHEQESFYGGGFRLTVFEVEDRAALQGTFFDVDRMSDDTLTRQEAALVDRVNETYAPEYPPVLPGSRLLKADRERYDDRLLSVYEPASARFYVYEDLL